MRPAHVYLICLLPLRTVSYLQNPRLLLLLGIFDLELTRVAAAACCLMLCYSHRISRAVQFMETLEEGLARMDINWTLSETIAWLGALREEVDSGKHGDADESEM